MVTGHFSIVKYLNTEKKSVAVFTMETDLFCFFLDLKVEFVKTPVVYQKRSLFKLFTAVGKSGILKEI